MGKIYLNSKIVYRVYGEYVFIYNLNSNQSFILNSASKYLIKFLEKKRSDREVIDYCTSIYKISKKNVEEEIFPLIRQLLDLGIFNADNINELGDNKKVNVKFNETTYNRLLEKTFFNEQNLFSVLIELTYDCNVSCKHCFISKKQSKYLSTNEVFEMIDQLHEANVMNIIFSGGEVLCRTDFFDILDYTSEKGFIIDIYSNCLQIDDNIIDKIVSYKPRSIQCSIYSHIPEKHDEITGQINSFSKSISVLEKFNKKGIMTAVKTLMMENNYLDFEGLLTLSKSIGASLQVGCSISPKTDGDLSPTNLRINDETNVVNLLKKLKEFNIISSSEITEEDMICTAGMNSLSIDPYGDIYLCNTLGLSIGNIKQNNIKDIWENSKVIKEWRNRKRKDLFECRDCQYLKFCEFCPAISFRETGNLLKKYDEACTWAKASYNLFSK